MKNQEKYSLQNVLLISNFKTLSQPNLTILQVIVTSMLPVKYIYYCNLMLRYSLLHRFIMKIISKP